MTEAVSPATWTFDAKLRLLRITLRGPWPSAQRTHQVVDTLREAGLVTPEIRLLVDVRAATAAGAPHFEEMQGLVVPRENSPRKRAYIATHAWQVGVCRQLCVLWQRPGYEAEVFTSEAAALVWLVSPASPSPVEPG